MKTKRIAEFSLSFLLSLSSLFSVAVPKVYADAPDGVAIQVSAMPTPALLTLMLLGVTAYAVRQAHK